ncbi:MAG: thioredoxin domain-containing protein [Alphaproteobacteria bacterium]|nr:thioredoxin domain-containing protein [Alphaproteobacteria bacterium]
MMQRHISAFFGAFALITLVFSATPAGAQAPGPRAQGLDMVIGAEEAPITMIEYASLTCPHCANLQIETMPKLKAEYIDTGKMKLVFRDFPLDRIALNAAMIARCAGPERFFTFIDVFFTQQSSWIKGNTADQIMVNLRRLARTGGMNDAAIDACLANTEIQNAVLQQSMKGEREHKVDSTPTLVINGTVYRGEASFEDLDKVLKPLAAKR